MVPVETYQTMNEAAGALGDGARYLGGGTIVMRDVNYGDQSFRKIVRVRQPERAIASNTGGIRIGAGATMTDILGSQDIAFLHPVAQKIGGPAIRNMATIGGNLFAQNPYGDMATALLALDAQIVMANGQPQPIESFLMDRDRARGVVSSVIVPRVEAGSFHYLKVSRVKPKGVAVITVAAWLRRGDPRVAFGNMGPTPMRAKAAERALANGFDGAAIQAACAVCTEGLQPADDPLASAWYRNEVAAVHLKRMLEAGGHR